MRSIDGNDVMTSPAEADFSWFMTATDGLMVMDPMMLYGGMNPMTGSASGDTVMGSTGSDFMDGMAGNDMLYAGDGGDMLSGGAGNDTLDGGVGMDTAMFSGNMLQYMITHQGDDGHLVEDAVAARDGIDLLHGIERLQFSDVSLAFDTNGHAGAAYALWNAAFNRAPAPEEIGRWIAHFDNNQSMVQVAQAFIDTYAPGLSNQDEVYILYQNVVGTPPGPSEMDYFMGILDRGEMTQAEMFVFAAETELNRADYIDLIANGISYMPWTEQA